MSTESNVNPYELLELQSEATEQEIRTAYRQRSLKVHPDRNPNNPDAARKFHELNQAYELLLDPLRRLALDAKLRLKKARDERFAGFDAKRKALLSELEEKERAFKRAKMEKEKEEVDRWRNEERIKEEGRKMREERMNEIKKREMEMEEERIKAENDMAPPPLGSLDTTVRLKYTMTNHPKLTTPSSLSTLLMQFGATDTESIVLSIKPPKKAPTKPPKFATALVPFKQIGDAFAAVCASGRAERGLEGIEVGWAEGKEPQILSWLKKMGKLSPEKVERTSDKEQVPSPQTQTTGDSSMYSSFPETLPEIPTPSAPKASVVPGLDYESLVLMRLRQAEREKLERSIREQEGDA